VNGSKILDECPKVPASQGFAMKRNARGRGKFHPSEMITDAPVRTPELRCNLAVGVAFKFQIDDLDVRDLLSFEPFLLRARYLFPRGLSLQGSEAPFVARFAGVSKLRLEHSSVSLRQRPPSFAQRDAVSRRPQRESGLRRNLKSNLSIHRRNAEAMACKVFVSCGQRDHERNVAKLIEKLLRDKFNLKPYLAFRTQSLEDIMTITEELRSSDYYLFVDFLRKGQSAQDLPCSLFTHQELALAHYLGFRDMIALQQTGAPLEGFLKYVLSNPEYLDTDADLLEKIEALVRGRKWSSDYSRHLVFSELQTDGPFVYQDQTGSHTMKVWNAKIENRRPDAAAVKAVCILSGLESADKPIPFTDRAYLKWCGQATYENTILPQNFGIVTLCSVHQDEPGLFLVSARDAVPRLPIVQTNGEYRLHFKAFSEGFPLLEFSVDFHLRWEKPTLSVWDSSMANVRGG
jgi:hypothetical protein